MCRSLGRSAAAEGPAPLGPSAAAIKKTCSERGKRKRMRRRVCWCLACKAMNLMCKAMPVMRHWAQPAPRLKD